MSGPKNPIPAYLSWTDESGAYKSFTFDVVEDEHWSGGGTVTRNPVEVGQKVSDNRRANPRRVTLRVFATNEPIASNQWASASLKAGDPVPLTFKSITPGTHVIQAPQWQSNLDLRVLAGTGAGLIGSGVGGAVGGKAGSTIGGTLGAVAGSALLGALLQGKIVPNAVTTNASQIRSSATSTKSPFTPKVLTLDSEDDFVQRTIQQLEAFDESGQTLDVFGTKTSCIGPTGIGGMVIESLSHERNHANGTGASITITLEQVRIVSTTSVPAPAPTALDASAPVSKGNVQPFDMESDVQAQTAADAAGPFVQGFQSGQDDTAAVLQ